MTYGTIKIINQEDRNDLQQFEVWVNGEYVASFLLKSDAILFADTLAGIYKYVVEK